MRGFAVIALLAVMLSSCASTPDEDRISQISAGSGAGAGAAVGAAAGAAAGSPVLGAAVGGVAGSIAGGIIGYYVTPKGCYFRNKRGELWKVPCRKPQRLAEGCFVDRGAFAFDDDHHFRKVACPRVPLPR